MMHMRDGNYHTERAFPFIENALRAVRAADFLMYLTTTYDSIAETSRSLGVWGRYPILEETVALGMGVSDDMRKLASLTWDTTEHGTRDAVHVSSLVYGNFFSTAQSQTFNGPLNRWASSSPNAQGYGMHGSVQGVGGSGKPMGQMPTSVRTDLNDACSVAAELLPEVRASLRETVPFPQPYVDHMSAKLVVNAALEGVIDPRTLRETVELAREVVPTFTVEGAPITELLNEALGQWASPLHVIGMSWDEIVAHHHAALRALEALRDRRAVFPR